MFEKEAKERARDFTDNEGRQVAYEYGFLDGADKATEELKEDNADLRQSLDWANEREKALKALFKKLKNKNKALEMYADLADEKIDELKAQIEKMKCCENCKHHYWLYEELSCRIHKIDVDTCNSWEVKEND